MEPMPQSRRRLCRPAPDASLGPRRVIAVPIQLVTNATPIVVTAIHHGFVTGDTVTVANVLGTTSANSNAANPSLDHHRYRYQQRHPARNARATRPSSSVLAPPAPR